MVTTSLLGLALLSSACHSSVPRAADPSQPVHLRPAPVVGQHVPPESEAASRRPGWFDPDEVTLSIELGGAEESEDGSRTVLHRLENRSRVTVCVGGSRELMVDGRGVRRSILRDALCIMPLLSAAPGESVTWTEPWSGGGCLPDAPPDLLEIMPSLECGAEVELRSHVWLFRLVDGIPKFGGIEVESEPLRVRLEPEAPVDQESPQ